MSEIIGRLDSHGLEKYRESFDKISSSYYNSSKLLKIVKLSDYMGDNSHEFKKLGKGMNIPFILFNEEPFVYNDLNVLWNQLGGGMSLGEEIYIKDCILDTPLVERFKETSIENDLEAHIIAILLDTNASADGIIMYAPIQFYTDFFTKWFKDQVITIDRGTGEVKIRETPIHIIWSHKYNEFNEFIIINKDFGEWICKPSIDERLLISTKLSKDRKKITYIVESEFSFSITNSDLVSVVYPT